MTKGEMELNVAIGANWHGAKWERANRDVTIERARQTGLGGRGVRIDGCNNTDEGNSTALPSLLTNNTH